MKKLTRIIFVMLLLLNPLTKSEAAYIGISDSNPGQGSAVAAFFTGDTKIKSAVLDGKPASFFEYKNFNAVVFPVSATAKPGNCKLKVIFEDGSFFDKQIAVKTTRFQKVVLGIPEELNMTPKTLTSNLQIQNNTISEVVDLVSDKTFFNQPFGLPLADNRKIGSRFGEIRQTGSEQIRHLGVDFTAPLGASVYAINSGVVKKVYFDTIYGNSILIDHGQGIFSAYFHMDKTIAKEGEEVKKGTKIGTVGKTGYATAPHLHLSVKINGISVDPIKFSSVFK